MSDSFALPVGDSAPIAAELKGDLAAFARAVDVQGGQLAWLLGAGASAMSGIPTAEALVLQFKHTLYCGSNNLGVQEVDPADRRTRELIERYFENRSGFPPKGDPEEYSVLFEEAYPSPDVRADVIEKLCAGHTPNFGHFVLAALMTTDHLRLVFTPNFDDLLEAAANSLIEVAGITPRPSIVVADLGDPSRAQRALQKESWPLIAKLHGDFRDVRLKNTRSELATQDAEMRRVLRAACGRFGLVVCGYSGRDASVMATLWDALADQGSYPNGIFWCYRSIDPPRQAVLDFLLAAKNAGRAVCLLPIDNFVELASVVQRAVHFSDKVRAALEGKQPRGVLEASPLPSGPTNPYPILRLNAVPLARLPQRVRVLSETSPSGLVAVATAVRTAHIRGLVARMSGGRLVAAGHDRELGETLAPLGISVTAGSVELDWSDETMDPAILGLSLDALTLGLGRTKGLRHVLSRQGHFVRIGDQADSSFERLREVCGSLTGTVPSTPLSWAEAVELTIERVESSWWLLLSPEVWVSPIPRDGEGETTLAQIRAYRASAAELIRRRRAQRYNREANAILDAWVKLLCSGRGPREVRTWNLAPEDGVDPTFEIVGISAFSRPFSMSAAHPSAEA
jgi:hypothetical protein